MISEENCYTFTILHTYQEGDSRTKRGDGLMVMVAQEDSWVWEAQGFGRFPEDSFLKTMSGYVS